MSLAPRSASKPSLQRKKRVTLTPGTIRSNAGLNHEYVRTVSSTLNRDKRLWQADFRGAVSKILKICISSLDCEVAGVWRAEGSGLHGSGLRCIAQYEAGIGAVEINVDADQEIDTTYLVGFLDSPSVMINDCFNDERLSAVRENYLTKYDIKSMLSATIYQNAQPCGLVIFEALETVKHWTETEQMLAQRMSELISQLLFSLELRGQQKMLDLLNRITRISSKELAPEQLVEFLMGQLHELAPQDWISFYKMTSATEAELVCAEGEKMPEYVKTAIKDIELEGELYSTLAESGDIYHINDCLSWDETLNLSAVDIAVALNFESIFFVPLKQGDHLLGFIQVWPRDRSFAYQDWQQIYRSLGASFAASYANAISVQEFMHDVSHDGLTGLSNQDQLFLDFINLDTRKPHLLLLMQLANFAQVNDTLGRENTDEVLKVVAKRLMEFAEARHDTEVYRFTGTEFCLIVNNPIGSKGVAEQLLEVVLAPIEIEGMSLVLQPVIGMTIRPDHGDQCEPLLKCLDEAVNSAKQEGLSYCLYEAGGAVQLSEDQQLLRDLEADLDDDRLMLYYQPIYDLSSGKMLACEALLRWQHQSLGFISPGRLIKLAEDAGLMKRLTRWIVKQTVSQISIFQLMEMDVKVSINISPLDLMDSELPSFIDEVLLEFSVSASELHLEVSETALMSDFKQMKSSLKALGDIGVRVDIDNFGLGYSSIANLFELPLSSIKIDRYFINDVSYSANHEAVVRAIIGMAHGLGVEVVGEGVENQDTVDKLKTMDCDLVQGYCFGKPVPAAEFIATAAET